MSISLPAVVKAESGSSGKYVLTPSFTLTHISNTTDLQSIKDIIGDQTEHVVGDSLISNLPAS